MLTIWKKPLQPGPGHQGFDIPAGAALLSVQLQNGGPTLWFLCDPEQPVKRRRVVVYGTGHVVEVALTPTIDSTAQQAAASYVGTYQLNGYVWHVFDDGEVTSS